MSWFDIVKYNRKHYVVADKKHNDKNVIEAHKEILSIVNRSNIKNKNMGRKIGAIRLGMPVITGEEFLQEPWNENNFFTKVDKFTNYIQNKINDSSRDEPILLRILRKLRELVDEINMWLDNPHWGNEDLKYVEDIYKRGAKAVLRLVGEYNTKLMRGKRY